MLAEGRAEGAWGAVDCSRTRIHCGNGGCRLLPRLDAKICGHGGFLDGCRGNRARLDQYVCSRLSCLEAHAKESLKKERELVLSLFQV